MQFDVNINVHLADTRVIGEVLNLLRAIKAQGIVTMKTLDELVAKVTEANTKTDSLLALFANLKQQIADLLSGAALPAGLQAKVDAVFDSVSAEADKVSAAIDANVPPTP